VDVKVRALVKILRGRNKKRRRRRRRQTIPGNY
jgi:hypothetical protein